ncbi:unnamed protein product [Laminaria digitata]
MPMVRFLNSISKTKAISLSFASATAVTTVFYSALQSTATPLRTMEPDWEAAQKEYTRFQDQDPMKIS